MPDRVQLKRSKGWRMPADTVKVDRTTRWGNPFTVADGGSAEAAVAQHGRWLRGEIAAPDGAPPPSAAEVRRLLGGRHLACWCPLGGPCHAELLLAIANAAAAADGGPSAPPPPAAATASPPRRRRARSSG